MKKQLMLIVSTMTLASAVHAKKMVILDSGSNVGFKTNRATISDQACFSIPDDIYFDTASSVNHWTYRQISFCPNGQAQDLSAQSAEIPRTLVYPDNSTNTGIGDSENHGSDVSNAGWDFESTPTNPHYQIQIFGWGSTLRPFSIGLQDKNSLGGDNVLAALNFIDQNSTSIGAINLSVVYRRKNNTGTYLPVQKCSNDEGQDVIDRLAAKGIPLVVGLANENIDSQANTWPACLDKVIKVGGKSANTSLSANGVGIGSMGIDFWAKDDVLGNSSGPGSSLAAPRVAKAYTMLSEAYPNATLDEKTRALELAADNTKTAVIQVNSTQASIYERPIVEKTNMLRAISFLAANPPTLISPPANPIEDVFYEERLLIGPVYGKDPTYFYDMNFDLNALIPNFNTPSQKFYQVVNLPAPRDMLISMEGAGSSFLVKVNNSLGGSYTLSGYSTTATTQSVVIHRKSILTGANSINIRPFSSSMHWGIREVKLSLVPPIELTVGQIDTNEYGYDDAIMPRYTGLRAKFDLPTVATDISLSMVGWDIDVDDETAIFVNGNYVGHLSTAGGSSSAYSPTDNFVVPVNVLVQGINEVELVQRETSFGTNSWTGYQDEKWAVKDMLVQTAPPDLVSNTPIIRDKRLSANSLFDVSITLRNIGTGASSPTIAKFYVSDDDVISATDIEVAIVNVQAIDGGASAMIDTSIQTSLVNQDKYIGVCVEPANGEMVINNNCSLASHLKDAPIMTPILILLMEDS